MHKLMTIEFQDGSKWGVPVELIALHRAHHYMSEFDGNLERSLNEDTLPLFESDDYEIHDWAANNMNWKDFDGHQVFLCDAPPIAFEDGWINGKKGFSEIDPPLELSVKQRTFQGDLESLINCYSMENGSNTPDFILAEYLTDCLAAFGKCARRRDTWYGHKTLNGPTETDLPVGPSPLGDE